MAFALATLTTHLPAAPTRLPAHSGRVHNTETAPMPRQHAVDRVARRPRHFADENALFAEQSVHQRRLANIRPTDNRHAGLRVGWLGTEPVSSFLLSFRGQQVVLRPLLAPLYREPRDDLVEQLRNPVAVLGRNLDHGFETQLEELHRRRLRPLVVGLVDGHQYGLPHRAQFLGDALVRPAAAIDDQDWQIGPQEGPPSLPDHKLCSGSAVMNIPGIGQLKVVLVPDRRPCQPVAGRARGVDNRPATAVAVEERRFPTFTGPPAQLTASKTHLHAQP